MQRTAAFLLELAIVVIVEDIMPRIAHFTPLVFCMPVKEYRFLIRVARVARRKYRRKALNARRWPKQSEPSRLLIRFTPRSLSPLTLAALTKILTRKVLTPLTVAVLT